MRLRGPILVVDDDPAIRALVTAVLTRAGFVACEASSAEEAIQIAQSVRPKLALIDIRLSGKASGYELCRELQQRHRRLPIIFISGERTEPFDRVAGLLIGGADYLVKPFDPDELVARVRNLTDRASTAGAPGEDATTVLTLREREILQLLAAGMSQAAIARELNRSPKTIAAHTHNVLSKLGVHSRAEAIAFAYRHGLATSAA